MSGRLYLDEIYSKSGQTKVLDTTSFDANNNFEASNTGFNLNYQSANAALNIVQSGTGDALRVNSNSLVVNASGNVGIGTSSPSTLVEAQSTDARITLIHTGGNSLQLYQQSVSSYLLADSDLNIYTNGSNRMRIDSSGNVVIGTSSPISQSLLTVNQDGISTAAGLIINQSNGLSNRAGGIFLSRGGDNRSSIEAEYFDGLKFAVKSGTGTLDERMRIDPSGRVTTPYQPHIFGTPGLGAGGANGKADRFSVLTSRGNLTASSGVITVPVDGVYAITFTTIAQNQANARIDNYIYVNNVVIASGLSEYDTDGFKHRSIAISMFIYEGDSIEFGSQSWYAPGNSFDNWQTASVTLLG